MKFEEKDLFKPELPEDEDKPKPRKGHPVLMVLAAVLLAAGWGAWQLHQRAEALRAAEASAAEARATGGVVKSAAGDPIPDAEARPAQAPPAAAGSLRRFYGVVFDLASKKPVSLAKVMLLVGPPGQAASMPPCEADLNGHYICDLPDGVDQVSVTVSSDGYRGQFEDFYPTLRKRSEAERRAVLAQRDGYLEPAPVTFMPSQETVCLDLAAVPLAWSSRSKTP